MNRKTKSISFNLDEKHERELLQYVEDKERGNFSRYIKRLIARDKETIELGASGVNIPAPVAPVAKKEVIKTDTMDSFL